jgi:hypothetical protein
MVPPISDTSLNKKAAYVRYWYSLLAGTIIGIISIPLVVFVIIEFHPLNDVVAEPDTDISMRLDVARGRSAAATHGEARHEVKPAGEVGLIGVRPLIQDQLYPWRPPEKVK